MPARGRAGKEEDARLLLLRARLLGESARGLAAAEGERARKEAEAALARAEARNPLLAFRIREARAALAAGRGRAN